MVVYVKFFISLVCYILRLLKPYKFHFGINAPFLLIGIDMCEDYQCITTSIFDCFRKLLLLYLFDGVFYFFVFIESLVTMDWFYIANVDTRLSK